jgi:hypothetical protein
MVIRPLKMLHDLTLHDSLLDLIVIIYLSLKKMTLSLVWDRPNYNNVSRKGWNVALVPTT